MPKNDKTQEKNDEETLDGLFEAMVDSYKDRIKKGEIESVFMVCENDRFSTRFDLWKQDGIIITSRENYNVDFKEDEDEPEKKAKKIKDGKAEEPEPAQVGEP